eukprot:tig00000792_g4219.t1
MPGDPTPYSSFLLTVVRHGETEANQAKVIQGQAGGKLTIRGKLQAERLGARLQSTQFAEVYCSDLHRTKQTLEGIRVHSKLKDVPVQFSELIREKAAGNYEGKGIGAQEADAKAQNVSIRKFKPEGGECWDEVLTRARTFVSLLLERHSHPVKQPAAGPSAGPAAAPAPAPSPSGAPAPRLSAALGSMRISAQPAAAAATAASPAFAAGVPLPGEPNILVVTHGGFIKELLNVLMLRAGTQQSPYFPNNTRNTGVYVLRVSRAAPTPAPAPAPGRGPAGPAPDFAATLLINNDASHLASPA